MMKSQVGYALVMLTAACVAPAAPVGSDPGEQGGGKADGAGGLHDVQCADAPATGAETGFRHVGSKITAALGDAHHRGIDLVAAASSEQQLIEGEISYGLFDKALEDEDVELFACRRGAWQPIGSAITDGEGHFSLTLTGDARLPLAMRDMFVSVTGDRTGAKFIAIVAPDDSALAVSDVDGTLTSSENAFVGTAFGIDPDIQPGAPAAWQAIAAQGMLPVYVTARARVYTEDTRSWLARKGMPRGAVRLAPHLLLPGSSTSDYKASTFAALEAELAITLGVGNRQTDIDAYARAGLPGDRIFIKLPEFEDEVAASIAAGKAIGIESYDELRPVR